MRAYSRFESTYWTGETGKKIRAGGRDAQLVGVYLLSNAHANMLGLYYLPIILIAHELGMTEQEARKALRWCCEVGFCAYDQASEYVWVYEMARIQIGEQLKPKDNRVRGLNDALALIQKNPFIPMFYEKYREAFYLEDRPDIARCKEVPWKPLGSQEQEQEQEQDQEIPCKGSPAAAGEPVVASRKPLTRAQQYPKLEALPRQGGGYVYPSDFETCWSEYPDRSGSNSKSKAYAAWRARVVAEEATLDELLQGTRRYAEWCVATRKVGTETVMQAQRFYGPGHEFKNNWRLPSTMQAKHGSVAEQAKRLGSTGGVLAGGGA